jgi:hypothetical protein
VPRALPSHKARPSHARATPPFLRRARTQLVAETKAVLAEAKKAFPALE